MINIIQRLFKISGQSHRVGLGRGRRKLIRNYPTSQRGEAAWLAGIERKYGGEVTNIPRRKFSPKENLRSELQIGGDRMYHNYYAHKYEQFLLPCAQSGRPVCLAEIGILRGTGLAIWCDLFPNGKIIGLDIDLSHIHDNMERLRNLGAFSKTVPLFYEFDQFVDNSKLLGRILGDDRLDICIDDGCHQDEAIITTLEMILPHMADSFVYFIEDHFTIHEKIRARYPQYEIDNHGKLTVIWKQWPHGIAPRRLPYIS